jgi:hypothetical protein
MSGAEVLQEEGGRSPRRLPPAPPPPRSPSPPTRCRHTRDAQAASWRCGGGRPSWNLQYMALAKAGGLEGASGGTQGHTDIDEGAIGFDAADNTLKLQSDGHILKVESEPIVQWHVPHGLYRISSRYLTTLPRRLPSPLSAAPAIKT